MRKRVYIRGIMFLFSIVKLNEIEKKVLTQISRTDIILFVTKTTSSIPTRWWVW